MRWSAPQISIILKTTIIFIAMICNIAAKYAGNPIITNNYTVFNIITVMDFKSQCTIFFIDFTKGPSSEPLQNDEFHPDSWTARSENQLSKGSFLMLPLSELIFSLSPSQTRLYDLLSFMVHLIYQSLHVQHRFCCFNNIWATIAIFRNTERPFKYRTRHRAVLRLGGKYQ